MSPMTLNVTPTGYYVFLVAWQEPAQPFALFGHVGPLGLHSLEHMNKGFFGPPSRKGKS